MKALFRSLLGVVGVSLIAISSFIAVAPASADSVVLPKRTEEIYKKILAYGATPEVAAALIGNSYKESTVNPEAIQGGGGVSSMSCNSANSSTSGRAVGLFQWDGSRKKNFLCAAEKAGVKWTDVDFQLKFLFEIEMGQEDPFTKAVYGKYAARFCAQTSESVDCSKVRSGGIEGGYKEWLKSNYAQGATVEFTGYWERPGKPGMPVRVKAATMALEKFSGVKADTSKTTTDKSTAEKAKTSGDGVPDEYDLKGMGSQQKWDEASTPEEKSYEDLDVQSQYILSKEQANLAAEKKPGAFFLQVGISMLGLCIMLWSVLLFASGLFDKSNTLFEVRMTKLISFGQLTYVADPEDRGKGRVGLNQILWRSAVGVGVGLMVVSGIFFGLVEGVMTWWS